MIDILATCIDLAGSSYPKKFGDNNVDPHESMSLVPILEEKKSK